MPKRKTIKKQIKNKEVFETKDTFSAAFKELESLFGEIKSVKTVQVGSSLLRERIKNFVKDYFSRLKPDLCDYEIQSGDLDLFMQRLIEITNFYTSVGVYRGVLNNIRKRFIGMETMWECKKSDHLLQQNQKEQYNSISISDKQIIDMLEQTVPTAAISYRQILEDFKKERFSYRGTVAELREILREVLDHLAPDKEVLSAPSFKFEEGLKKPTMKQKALFILRSRDEGNDIINMAGNAAIVVDDAVARLVRTTYERGCDSTHKSKGLSEAVKIKRYLDALLCELLEIN